MLTLPFDPNKLIPIYKRNKVASVGIFGSMARGDYHPESDVDLLVKFSERIGLLALIRLERELSEALGRETDVVTEAAISPYLRDQILSEVKIIYEA